MLGLDVPITVAPCVKATLRKHPAYAESVNRLSHAGAAFLDPDVVTFRGEDGLAAFDWRLIIEAVDAGGAGADDLE